LLAKEAITVDHVSEGRLEVGIGAGWYVPEHEAYGLAFEPPAQLVDRFEEAVEIIDSMLRNDLTTFHGDHYDLTEAPCRPRPLQLPRPPLTIGAKGRRMLGICAQWADRWNSSGTVEDLRTRNEILSEHCDRIGRNPDEIIRSLYGWASIMPYDPWASADAFEEVIGRYAEAGINEFVIDHPGPERFPVLERVATDVIPRLRAQSMT
jgi:alkanesulfonate monooxygenase SsuD/methylene tetrahydromethanopterin reductase-like flavin-dependent oxidoreductase (luciferase family)